MPISVILKQSCNKAKTNQKSRLQLTFTLFNFVLLT